MGSMKWRFVGVLAAALAVLSGGLLWRANQAPAVSMSSSASQAGHHAAAASSGSGGDWRSDGETTGAWLAASWSSPVDVRRVVLRQPAGAPTIVSGYLSFSDGSRLRVQLGEETTTVPVVPRRITSVRFTVIEAAEGADAVSLDELSADDESAGPPVEVGDGPSNLASSAVGLNAALGDDDPATTAALDGEALDVEWGRPQEVDRIAVTGSSSGAALVSGSLEFSDGSTVPIGAVTADPARPTVVAFMARSVTSVRLVADQGAGDGPIRLGGIAVHPRGSDPSGPSDPTALSDSDNTPENPASCAPPGPRPTDATGVVVWCPTNGAVVDERISLSVGAGPSYSSVRAEVWPSQKPSGASTSQAVDLDAGGNASLSLYAPSLASGPFTVAVIAEGDGVDATTTHLQLVLPGAPAQSGDQEPAGRSLVYSDDFDSALSASRSGEGTDYVAGKPEVGGVTDFGDVVFGDPQSGADTVADGDGYLRLSAEPREDGGPGPQHVGGMIASARPGGSGFSAQYGYFEARMLAPAEPGTWPAFWLLSNPDLVADQPVGSEIDAVELYGHDPDSTCSTSHQYPDPTGLGLTLCDRRFASDREALQWHVYGVDVRPDRIVYFIDGRKVGEAPPVGPAETPMFFLLDLSLGGGWPVDLSSTRERADLYVDWVRVYE